MDNIKKELKKLRREQAKRVMPLIGPLLDAYDGLYADVANELPDNFLEIMQELKDAVEGDDDV